METIRRSFETALSFGEDGEKQVAEYLLNKGVSIIPFYQFDPSSAPYLLFGDKKYILPDLLCTKNSKVFFVECKRKNRWVSFRGKTETGFTNRLLEQYRAIQNITSITIYTCFIMKDSAENKYKDFRPPNGLYILPSINTAGRLWDGTNGKGRFIEHPIYLWDYKDMVYAPEFEDSE